MIIVSNQEEEGLKASQNSYFAWFKTIQKKGGNPKGQGLLEALILSLALITLIYCTLLFFWMGTSLLWIEHQLYQGIVCVAEQKELNLCKQRVLKQINKLNSVGVIKALKIQNFQNQWKGEILWNFYKKDFMIQQSLSLP